MVKEIYIRTPNDPNFVPNIIDYSNEVESTLSQLKMILGTNKGDVLGTYDFGLDLNYLVFGTKLPKEEIRQRLLDQIVSYGNISKNISLDIDINFGQSGYGYDYAIIDIIINGKKKGFFYGRINVESKSRGYYRIN